MPAGITKVTTGHPLRQRVAAACCTAALVLCGCMASAQAPAAPAATVLTGLDVLLRDGPGSLGGRRVGLITNHTGLSATGASGIDLLHRHPGIRLVALYSPEHSITGRVLAGEKVESGRDSGTGLPIHSLYGDTRKPTAQMLRDVDVLLFDIQDVGARYYTYVWTMALALQAAAENDKEIVVLDRPNPIGGTHVQGNVLDPAFATFVGLYPVPMRHGMTAGELARYINAEHRINARLTVVPLENWRRTMWFPDTGLPWVALSPNMPNIEAATHYPGTCLFEGTNLSVGRGTPVAFTHIGAPWLDPARVIERLRAHALPGVRFEAVTFTPRAPGDGKYPDVTVRGIRFITTDRLTYDPTRTAIATLIEMRALHADSLTFNVAHFDRLAGTDRVRTLVLAGETLDRITATWPAQLASFDAARRRHLLYP